MTPPGPRPSLTASASPGRPKVTIRETRRPARQPSTPPCGARNFNKSIYRRRNVVERRFHRLKQRRGNAARYDKRPDCHLAALTFVGTSI
jgi:transposase